MKCYFFGTFNPIHKGHLEIARKIREQFDFEAIIFVPSYCPPHKDPNVSAEDRLKMAKIAAGKNNVSDAEFFLPIPSYSSKTIQALLKKDKTEKLNFIIGFDAFSKIESWKNPDYLKSHVNFIVIPRNWEGINPFEHLKKRGWNFQIANIDFIDISSDMIRKRVEAGDSITEFVDKKTEDYIYEHGLYKKQAQRVSY